MSFTKLKAISALLTAINFINNNNNKNQAKWWQSLHRTMLRGVLGKTLRLVGYTIQYGCIAHCAFEYVGGVVMCSGPSMEPTIQNSDIVFAENLSRHFYGIQRGDIVIAKSPSDPKSNICKRVIGLEGDKIYTTSSSNFFKSHNYRFKKFWPNKYKNIKLHGASQ
ncbi:mitochondrial inner membrane protease subunit 1 isoform X4 [Tupaia chinensis]|uniref:mitochondrial inner membrane protease subunit 1 isoform X4 n=1 Tax=Tupaia chinensis TaxID=246437 RepID=UPI0007041305|nr:mitochondrial inner membrane protease subunit 1 isoform X4 [Tupaia chinensis]